MANNSEDRSSFVTMLISVAFVLVTAISNIIAGKIHALPFGLRMDGGNILYPLSGFLTDTSSEVFGQKKVRQLTIIGVITSIFISLVFAVVVAWPAPADFLYSEAYAIVLGQSIRIVIASLCAWAIATIVDSKLLQMMKKRFAEKGVDTNNKFYMFLRTFGSSIPAQILDATVFATIAFIGTMTTAELITVAATGFGIKILVQLLLQPLLVNLIPYIKRMTGLDTVDAN